MIKLSGRDFDKNVYYISQITEEKDNYNLECFFLEESLEYYILRIDKIFYTDSLYIILQMDKE